MDFAISGEGEKLQERLQRRAKQRPESSWLIEWWNDAAYLTDSEPLVFFVSYFYAFKDLVPSMNPRPAAPRVQTAVAAALVFEALRFRDLIADSTLPPETVGGRYTFFVQAKILTNMCGGRQIYVYFCPQFCGNMVLASSSSVCV